MLSVREESGGGQRHARGEQVRLRVEGRDLPQAKATLALAHIQPRRGQEFPVGGEDHRMTVLPVQQRRCRRAASNHLPVRRIPKLKLGRRRGLVPSAAHEPFAIGGEDCREPGAGESPDFPPAGRVPDSDPAADVWTGRWPVASRQQLAIGRERQGPGGTGQLFNSRKSSSPGPGTWRWSKMVARRGCSLPGLVGRPSFRTRRH